MKIQDVMTRDVESCSPEESLCRAARIMWERDCGCVPVVDDTGAVRGMITDRDICMAAYTQGRPLHEIAVSGAMSAEVYRCRPEDSIEAALMLMQRNKVRRAPVVDGDRLVGVVSLSDLLARSSSADARRERALRPEMLVQALVVITARNGEEGRDSRAIEDSSRTALRSPDVRA